MSHQKLTEQQLIQFKRVLVAADFSEGARTALRHAAVIAKKYSARLYVVHVLSSVGYRMVGYDAEVQAAELVAHELKELWDKLEGSKDPGAIELELIVRQGDVLAEVQDLLVREGVDLVVVGTHGRSGLAKVMLGSAAESTFRNVTSPVLTVGPGSSPDWPQREKAILLATDFGDTSLGALPYAMSIANRSGAKLIVLHVANSLAEPDGTLIVSAAREARDKETTQDLTRRLRSLLPPSMVSDTQVRIGSDKPADAILAQAESSEVGLIVLGLHHHSILVRKGHSLSTTAYDVVAGATCPVLTVRS